MAEQANPNGNQNRNQHATPNLNGNQNASSSQGGTIPNQGGANFNLIDPRLQEFVIPTASPYFLHPNESTAAILVTPLLSGDNFHIWSRDVKTALISKNKLGFINGIIPQPDVNDKLFSVWEQCNNMVCKWIRNSTIQSISQSVMWVSSAKELWEDLVERFSNIDCFRLSDLLGEFHALNQEEKSVMDYYTALKTLWDEMAIMRPIPQCSCTPRCLCGGGMALAFKNYMENEYVIKFLKGLNEEYSQVRSQIFLMVPLPSIKAAFSMVIKFDRQKHSHGSKNLMVLASRGVSQASLQNGAMSKQFSQQNYKQFDRQSGSGNVFKSEGMNRKFSSGVGNRPENGGRPQCTYCGLLGHIEDKCFRKHGFPPRESTFKQKRRLNAVEGSFYEGNEDVVSTECTDQHVGASVDNNVSNVAGISQKQIAQLLQLLHTQSQPTDHHINQISLASDFTKSHEDIPGYAEPYEDFFS